MGQQPPPANIDVLQTAADAGDNAALAKLARVYLRGDGVPADVAKGMELLAKAGAGGDSWSYLLLGQTYVEGKLVPLDARSAVKNFTSAMTAGNAAAALTLARIYHDGLGEIPADPAKALTILRDTAAAGDLPAKVQLGNWLLGADAETDRAEGVKLLQEAVDTGDVGALRPLGSAYLKGTGVTQDFGKGLAMLEQAGAGGDGWAYYSLGAAFRDGALTEIDAAKSIDYFTKASEAGVGDALMQLAGIYSKGLGSQPAEPAQSIVLLRKVADTGNLSAKTELSRLLLASGTPEEQSEGIALLQASAEADDPKAIMELGRRYLAGDGIVQDTGKGIAELERAGEKGDSWAYFRAAVAYRDGKVTPTDGERSVELFEKSLALANAQAAMELSTIYAKGLGDVAPDTALSLSYLQKATELGSEPAKQALARRYLNGDGVARDLDRAVGLYEESNGYAELTQALLNGTQQVKADPKRALEILRQGIADQKPAALHQMVTLLRRGVPGTLPPEPRAARAMLEENAGMLDSETLAVENVLLRAFDGASASNLEAIASEFGRIGPARGREVLPTVLAVNPNAYVYALQKSLKGMGKYNGPLHGSLTSSTISAINAACAELGASDACRKGPLTQVAGAALAGVIWPRP